MAQSDPDRIEEIFHAALELPESERSAFVEKKCEGESVCIREVMSLLEARGGRGMLDDPVIVLGSTPEQLIGTPIDGRYEIESELPHGGMSRLYVALDKKLNNHRVVVKILSKELVQNPFARQHFDQEVEALLRLKHPGVVRVTDRGDLPDGSPYIVMEYVDGESLRPQIQNEGMVLTRAASILTQVGAALEHVHQNGVVHRDVKPENIMLRRGTDSVVLIDFGIAKVMESVVASSTVDGKSAGTLVYMSSEQLLGKKVKAESDVYSMAVVAYELITGRRPFAPHSDAHLLELQRKGVRAKPTDLRPGLSKNAEGIILRALSFDSNKRFRSAKAFGDELAAALNESSGNNNPTTSIWKWLKVVAGVLILALLSFGIYRYIVRPPIQLQPQGFNYWLMVESKGQQAFKSNGDDKFANGDNFQLNVETVDSGYVYIFNEGPTETGSTSFKLIYPKNVNDGSAFVGANQTLQLEWNTFRGPAGTDNYWIVWSAQPVSELESAKVEALKHPEGSLTGENLLKVNDYLTKKDKEIMAVASKMSASQEVQVRKRTDIVLDFAKFEHR
jgi:serine/threonine protein kinase